MARILIVDDEEQVRRLLGELLFRAGHELHTAANAELALELCVPPSRFDLVLSDVVMPGKDGHELARRIAVRCPESRVILMSGFDPGCEECPYISKCELIAKPFFFKDVVTRVTDALVASPKPIRTDFLSRPESFG